MVVGLYLVARILFESTVDFWDVFSQIAQDRAIDLVIKFIKLKVIK